MSQKYLTSLTPIQKSQLKTLRCNNFGQLLSAVLDATRVSQTLLAKIIDINPSQISRIIGQKSNPRSNTIKNIELALFRLEYPITFHSNETESKDLEWFILLDEDKSEKMIKNDPSTDLYSIYKDDIFEAIDNGFMQTIGTPNADQLMSRAGYFLKSNNFDLLEGFKILLQFEKHIVELMQILKFAEEKEENPLFERLFSLKKKLSGLQIEYEKVLVMTGYVIQSSKYKYGELDDN